MLRFSLAGIPVSVHVSFVIIALVSPFPRSADTVTMVEDTALWVVVAFLAVLAHEAGHAFSARHFGAEPVSITLFALGGVTTFAAVESLTPKRRLVIAAAGSLVGIVLGGTVWLLFRAGVFDEFRVAWLAAVGFIWAGLGWGLLNWIPIRPLDGGAILTSFLEIVMPTRALVVAKVISAIAGAAAAFVLFRMGALFGAVFVVLITLTGLRSDPGERSRPETRTPPPPMVDGMAPPPPPGNIPATRPSEPGADDAARPPQFPI